MSAPGSGKITVLIADDHPVVRQGLRVLLSLHSDIEVLRLRGVGVRKGGSVSYTHLTLPTN